MENIIVKGQSPELVAINRKLEEIPQKIATLEIEKENAREEYLRAKATYENEFSKNLMRTKLQNPAFTCQEIKAETIVKVYDFKIEYLKKEAIYRRLVGEIKNLQTELESVFEQCYNLRAEMKLQK